MSEPLVLDFETKAIERRPAYPPEPVGVALLTPVGVPNYFAWGHRDVKMPSNYTTALTTMRQHNHWLCHHAGFDVVVAMERMGLPMPERVDDTLFLLFLMDPYGNQSLKPSAERYLGMKPSEQDAVRDWLYANKVVRKNTKKWGAHISEAPSYVVGPYAVGDIVRTRDLFELLRPQVEELGMGPAYERECEIFPMLVDNEVTGVQLAERRLKQDLAAFEERLGCAAQRVFKILGKSFDIGNRNELADVLEENDIALPVTEKGNRRTAKGALDEVIPDGKLKGWLLYHSALTQALSHFMRPWAEMGGLAHVKWNQTKNDDNTRGTKTGRLSSQPNFQNLTSGDTRDELIATLARHLGGDAKYAPVPDIRGYVVAPKGYALFGRDYAQQELRILAHFEDGPLAQAYNDDPNVDVHKLVQGLMLEATGTEYPRLYVKRTNFGKIYGLGAPGLSRQLKISLDEASDVLAAHRTALPSVDDLGREIRKIGDRGEPIWTLGGRRYFSPADSAEGRSNAYKLLNYLVQGSAADQTKEAMRLWWNEISGTDTRFVVQVHDELLGMAPTDKVRRASKLLDECMVGAFSLGVPVRTTAEFGRNWGAMK